MKQTLRSVIDSQRYSLTTPPAWIASIDSFAYILYHYLFILFFEIFFPSILPLFEKGREEGEKEREREREREFESCSGAEVGGVTPEMCGV